MAAAQPLGADLAGWPRRRLGGTSSIMWPITVVGSSIAVAAFGVLGLYLVGNAGSEEVDAGAAVGRPDAVGSTAPSAGATSGTDLDGSAWHSPDGEDDSASTGIESGPPSSPETSDDGTGDEGDGGGESSTPTTDGPEPTIGSEAEDPSTRQVPAPTEPVGPAIFTRANLGSERLASLVVIDQRLITSASALKGHSTVFLRIAGRWFRANVEQADMASDVAVVGLYNDAMELDLPPVSAAEEPVENGTDAYVGYCDSEVVRTAALRTAPDDNEEATGPDADGAAGDSGDAEARSSGDGDRSAPTDRSAEADTGTESNGQAAGPGSTRAGDGTAAGERSGTEVEPGASAPEAPDASSPQAAGPAGAGTDPGCGNGPTEPESADVVPPAPDEPSVQKTPAPGHQPDHETGDPDGIRGSQHARAGVVISTALPATTLADHIVYEPILTGIQRSDGMAGGPLRDETGRMIGLILGSSNPLVAALPIERVSAIANALTTWGTGSRAWLGIEVRAMTIGLRVESVDENSPAIDKLQRGDHLIAVDGERLQGTDHLTYLVREAGVGGELRLSFRRPGQGRQQVEVEVVAEPG